jgi:transposase-like protein
MARPATADEFQEYRENELCPYCFAEDVVENGSTVEGGITRIFKYCTKCEWKWTENWENGRMTGLWLDDAD